MSTPSIQRKPSLFGLFKREKHPTKTSTEKTSTVASQKMQESLHNNPIPAQLQNASPELTQTNSSVPHANQVTLIKPKPPIPPPRSVQGPTPLSRTSRPPNKEEGSVFLASIIEAKESLRKSPTSQEKQPISSLELTNNKGILKTHTHPDANQTSTKKSVTFHATNASQQSSENKPTEALPKKLKSPPPVVPPRSLSTQLSSTIEKRSGDLPETNVHSEFDQLEKEMNAMLEELQNYSIEIENKKKNP